MKLQLSALAIALAAVLPIAAHADVPGQHPGYLHALSDLRDARGNIESRPGDVAVSGQEDVAIDEIDRAIGELKKASWLDGKDMRDHPHEDANLDRPGRLHHAVELLKRAEDDLARPEDNPEARDLQGRALNHVHNALEASKRAIHDLEHRNY